MVDPEIRAESFNELLDDILAEHVKDKKIVYTSYRGDDFVGGELILRFSNGEKVNVRTDYPIMLNDLLLERIENTPDS